jgi:3-dehydroquinate synthetase
LGHTLGHAIESHFDYELLHGEAVGLGMIFATMLSHRLGGSYDWRALEHAVFTRLAYRSLDEFDWNGEKLLDLTRLDKKNHKGTVRWVIPWEPGKLSVRDEGIDEEILTDTMGDFIQKIRENTPR